VQLDPALLSRIQFGFVIALHFLLPAFTIGLASYIVMLEGPRLAARQPARKAIYLRISTFWTRIFAVAVG
jgi:cytochrome bd ubiquinol oxidase subunit I